MCEVARALVDEPRRLFDDPAAGLDDEESARLSAPIREVAAERVSILLIARSSWALWIVAGSRGSFAGMVSFFRVTLSGNAMRDRAVDR